ncbi:dihydroneopterin aldolase 2 isoform X1 [Musa acuminata AAA Group]|uniref:dihydroneopterin aldolase 2 isoform X1 n=2 Tax=Musa acuminata AAA Group TaxID=214697 RepID=UPI0031E1C707
MTIPSSSFARRNCSTSMGERDFVDKDKLILRGLQFHGFHGVKLEEKKLGQKFVIDVDAWMDLSNAGKSDDISVTVSYTAIYRIVKEVVEGPSQNLLESVAHLIANTTLLQFPQISAVRVKVGKPHVAVRGTIDYLGVEILRYKKASSVD